jgi:hypothetical protein
MAAAVHELCVIGHPSLLGGADTELDHQIRCWQFMGITVHICPTGPLDQNLIAMNLSERGCIYHTPLDWQSVEGLHCISFCNGEFLKHLPIIRSYARSTTFVNCMTWNFPLEIEMQSRGLIDFHLYQTDHAQNKVSAELASYGVYRPLRFQPYFHAADFPFCEERPRDKFRFGRISRGDGDKFGAAQLWIYDTMTAPVLKEGWIVGWDQRSAGKFSHQPPDFVQTFPEGGKSQQDFYRFAEAVIMTTDTFENLPRVGMEAMASGSLLVVDKRGGWNVLVDDGVTGWLCMDQREFIYKASRCAFEHEETQMMRIRAREKLEQNWGLTASAETWEKVFQQMAALRR